MTAYKTYEFTEAYIKQKGLIKANNILFITELFIQSDEVKITFKMNITIETFKMNIIIKASEASEVITVIYIDLIINNIINLFTNIDEFETNFINLLLFEIFIVIMIFKISEMNIMIIIDLNINMITELFI